MDMPQLLQMKQKEREALRSLEQISNQPDNLPQRVGTAKLPKRKKQKIVRNEQHHRSTDLQNIRSSKSYKLPLIPSRPNFENTVTIQDTAQRAQGYVLFEKGLGSFGSVKIKKDGMGKYMDSSNKFMKFYSQSNEQEIELIRLWLQAKKQSWRVVNSFFSKKKAVSEKHSVNKHLQIRNIL